MEEVVSCRIRLSKKPILSLLIFTFDPSASQENMTLPSLLWERFAVSAGEEKVRIATVPLAIGAGP